MEPAMPLSHWDFVLKEVTWMAMDFAQVSRLTVTVEHSSMSCLQLNCCVNISPQHTYCMRYACIREPARAV